MRAPRPFPEYPRKLDKAGRLRIKCAGRHYYLPKPIGSPASIAEYERLRLEHAAGHLQSAPHLPSTVGLTISELIADFLRADPRGTCDKEVIAIGRACVPLERLFGATQAGEFTSLRLKALQDAMASGAWMTDGERDGRPWGRKYCNLQLARVLRVFRWAESRELVPEGRWGHLKALPPLKRNDRRVADTAPRRPVDYEQHIRPILVHLPPPVRVMVLLQYHAGMRPSEVCSMKRSEVDQASVAGIWLYVPERHKGTWRGDDLVKTLGPICQRELLPWLMATEPSGYIFVPHKRRLGQPHYTAGGYFQAVQRACLAAGVEHFSPYQIRHAMARDARRLGGLDKARAFLGQRSIGAASKYSSEQDLEAAIELAKKIG